MAEQILLDMMVFFFLLLEYERVIVNRKRHSYTKGLPTDTDDPAHRVAPSWQVGGIRSAYARY